MDKETNRMSLTLTSEATEVLNKHASVRKRGEFLSNLIMGYEHNENAIAAVDVETIKLQMVGMSSMIKSLESRQLQTERTVAAMIADSSC